MSPSLPKVEYQLPAAASGSESRGLIAIIGEAPGAEEVKQGRPFIGRSGQLLDKNLNAAGVDRASCLVANVFRFQPPQNKVAHFFISARKSKETGEGYSTAYGKFASGFVREEFAGELSNLAATLQKLKPAIIITLGRTPLWALTGCDGIVALRGQLQDCRLANGIPVMPTYHPSYIIRGNWGQEPLFLGDIKKAKELAEGAVKGQKMHKLCA